MTETATRKDVDALFEAGAHFGYSRTRRHPSVSSFLFGTKNRSDIFDLEKTADALEEAKKFVAEIAAAGKKILFVGGKNEARSIIKLAAEKLDVFYVSGRWVGGTLTNLPEIRKRTNRLERLVADQEKGDLEKYTKRERLLIGREVEDLGQLFGGIAGMKDLPAALFVIDPKHEEKAIREAVKKNIPIIALGSSDCDLSEVTYPIPANDATAKSITYIVDEITKAYEDAYKKAVDPVVTTRKKAE